MYATTMTMVGRLVDRPQGWALDGVPKASFRLARTERRIDQGRGGWVDGATLYLTVNCWRMLAERVLASLGKGDPVIVVGRLRTREWNDKDGGKHSVTELEAMSVGPDLALCSVGAVRRLTASGAASPDSVPRDAEMVRARLVDPGVVDAEPPDADAGGEELPWNAGPLVADPGTAQAERAEAGVGR